MPDLFRTIALAAAPFLFATATHANEKTLRFPSIPVVIEKAPAAPAIHDLMPLQALKTNRLSFFDYHQFRIGQPIARNTNLPNHQPAGQVSIQQSHALEKRINVRQSFDHYDLHTSYRLIANKLAPDQIDELEITHFSSQLPNSLLQQKLQQALTNKFGHPLSFEQLRALHLEGLSRELRIQRGKLVQLEQQARKSAALNLFLERRQWRIQKLEREMAQTRNSNALSADVLCRSLQIIGNHCHFRGTARADTEGLLISGRQPCRIWLRHDGEMLSLCQATGAMVIRITSPTVTRSNYLRTQARLHQFEFRL